MSERFLQPGHDIESAPSPVPPRRIGGIGHGLQFIENELGNDEQALEKACLRKSAMRPSMRALESRYRTSGRREEEGSPEMRRRRT